MGPAYFPAPEAPTGLGLVSVMNGASPGLPELGDSGEEGREAAWGLFIYFYPALFVEDLR